MKIPTKLLIRAPLKNSNGEINFIFSSFLWVKKSRFGSVSTVQKVSQNVFVLPAKTLGIRWAHSSSSRFSPTLGRPLWRVSWDWSPTVAAPDRPNRRVDSGFRRIVKPKGWKSAWFSPNFISSTVFQIGVRGVFANFPWFVKWWVELFVAEKFLKRFC